MLNIKASERARVVAKIDPDVYTPAALTSEWVSMAAYKTVLAIVQTGTLGASATVNAKLQQATDGAGTSAKDITGKAITELSASDKQALIEVRDDELDVENDFTHVALVMTGAVGTSDLSAIVLGFDVTESETSDLGSVSEIV
jgi:hypothetical protein